MASCSGFESTWLISIKHLPRIQNTVRVERVAQLAHHPHLSVTSERGQKGFLRQTDAVFAGDSAAKTYGFSEDFFERFFDAVHFLFVSLVRQERRVQIPVAHVSERANLQSVLFGGGLDK